MKRALHPWLVAVLLSSACAMEDPEVGEQSDPLLDSRSRTLSGVSAVRDVATDSCDQDTYADASWMSATSPHFVARYFPGTAAETDMAEILARREAAYENIRQELGLAATPTISIHLSPSRLAASTHGRAYGRAWPGQDRYEVIYTGADDSYEVVRLGHELTHVLEYYIDTANPKRIPMLTEGLAEYLDQSGRDLHQDYARQLLAGMETRVYVATFESTDVNGRNYGRAGSLVQFLVERHGMATFLDIFKATRVTWSGGCWTSPTHGCIGTAAALTQLLDGVLQSVTGERWSDVQPAWQAEVFSAMATVNLSLPPADVYEIRNLVAVMDQAIGGDDPARYRSTMEGFYCEWGGESLRTEIAARATGAFGSTTSRVLRILPTGIKNFTTARAIVTRADEHGPGPAMNLALERFPDGWRVTYGPDWW